MSTRSRLAVIACSLLPFASHHAAAVTTSCTTAPAYTCANGTTTFPGTAAGTVGLAAGTINQIGNLALNNAGTTSAVVNSASNPSIYSFLWGGGSLLVQEEIGNNGVGDAVDVELDSLATSTSVSILQNYASITIPFTSSPSIEYTVYNGFLAAGTYAIDTYLAINNATDPAFQVNFTVPEPGSFAILATVMTLIGRRRRKASLATG